MRYLNFIIISLSLLIGCQTPYNSNTTNNDATLPIYCSTTGTTYYVSNEGNDSADGITISTPWRTITKVNNMSFSPGDKILFRSGDTFTGQLIPKSGTSNNWIKYGSYGSGDKPKIKGEVFSISEWLIDSGNIWTLDYKLIDNTTKGVYDLLLDGSSGVKKLDKSTLLNPGDFYFDYTSGYLYLYSTSNPLNVYNNIEAKLTKHIIDMANTSYVLFENLHLTDGSAHGFGGANTDHLIIRNCEFSYIGGGVLSYVNNIYTKYGNGIEFWGNAHDNLVESNYFYEIYDTAVTNQNHSSSAKQENIYYVNNIIRNCGLSSFELWNRPSSSTMKNIYFVNNTSINPGQGWGSDRPDKNSFHVASFGSTALTNNIVIKNNIFYSSSTPVGIGPLNYHAFFYDENENNSYYNYIIDNNLWSMPNPLWGINKPPNTYTTFDSWSKINNQSTNGITLNPQFVDFENNNFALKSSSPCIDAGVATFRTTDFYGNKINGTPDIGAIEF